MKRVLIVDNSRLMRSILKELLTELGMEPIGEAVNVEEGIKAYQALQPDLVTLDLIMPGASGLEMLQEIRSTNPNAKVLVITESGQAAVEQQVSKLGACGILHKPITREALQEALERIDATPGGLHGRPAQPKALVIDDSLVMRTMIKVLLGELGVEIIGEAVDAVEAVKAYHDYKPDFVTLDLIMPGGSGFDALRKIIAQDPKAKIILVSAVAQDKVTEQALRLGACAVLQKPLTPETVKNTLDKLFPPTRSSPPEILPTKVSEQRSLKDLTPDQLKSLEDIFRSGSESCLQAMDTICNARWRVSGIRLLDGANPEVAEIMDPAHARQVTFVQMLVAKDIPTVCLLFISQEGVKQILSLLTENQHGETNPDENHLVLMEWANILITAILNAFSNTMGSALVSTQPALVDWPPEEVLTRSIKEISDLPERSILVRVQYHCDGLEADCETLFIFRTDSMPKLLGVNV